MTHPRNEIPTNKQKTINSRKLVPTKLNDSTVFDLIWQNCKSSSFGGIFKQFIVTSTKKKNIYVMLHVVKKKDNLIDYTKNSNLARTMYQRFLLMHTNDKLRIRRGRQESDRVVTKNIYFYLKQKIHLKYEVHFCIFHVKNTL